MKASVLEKRKIERKRQIPNRMRDRNQHRELKPKREVQRRELSAKSVSALTSPIPYIAGLRGTVLVNESREDDCGCAAFVLRSTFGTPLVFVAHTCLVVRMNSDGVEAQEAMTVPF